MEHYCAYLRKSRVDLEQERHSSGSTLDRHRELLTALSLQLQKPIERFYEEVVSGESISGRYSSFCLILKTAPGVVFFVWM